MNEALPGLRLEDFRSALARLDDALGQPLDEYVRDAAIQRFEFSFELAWKCVQALARLEGLDVASPRAAFRAALKLGLIQDDPAWLSMMDDRNLSSHTYDLDLAEAVYGRLPKHALALHGLLENLASRLGPL
jgi:nucleotidyltransferase substrate binding protein (TIGR01987 family)